MPNIDVKKIDQNTIEFWRFNTENCDTSSVQIQRENLLSLLDLASKALATPNHLKDVKMEQLEIDGLCRRLEEHATDWNGAQMPDGEPAKGDPTAGTLRQAATLIRSLSSRAKEAERARREEELREDARLGAALARAETTETRAEELEKALEEVKGVWKPISALWSKPAECSKGCPPRQVCDFCQRELFLGWNGDYVELWNTTNYYLCRERNEPHWKHMAEEAARLTHFMAFDMPDSACTTLEAPNA